METTPELKALKDRFRYLETEDQDAILKKRAEMKKKVRRDSHQMAETGERSGEEIVINDVKYSSYHKAALGTGMSLTMAKRYGKQLRESSFSELTVDARIKTTFVFKKVKES